MKIEVEIGKDAIANILTDALEGGSNYWYMITERIEPNTWVFSTFKDMAGKKSPYFCDVPLNEGGSLMIDDSNADSPELKEPVRLDYERIKYGLDIMAKDYPNHFANFIKGDTDADTADVFLQCCILGKTIYG